MQALDRKDAEQDANGRRLLSRAKARNIRPGAETLKGTSKNSSRQVAANLTR